MQFTLSTTLALLALASSSVATTSCLTHFGKHESSQSFTFEGSLSSKNCFGAVGKPWEHNSKPGWDCGKKPAGSVPKWDGGDSAWCSSAKHRKHDFCKKGNPCTELPKPVDPANWGKKGSHDWPKPKHPKHKKPEHGKPAPKHPDHPKHPEHPKHPASSKPAPSHPATTKSASKEHASSSSAPVSTTKNAHPHPHPHPHPTASHSTTAAPPAPTGPTCTSGYQLVGRNLTTVADSGVYFGQTVGVAIRDDPHYLTYGLADKHEDCLKACDQVAGCVFVNAYLDVQEDGTDDPVPEKHSGKYTCALFSACSDKSKADNFGGQNDPNYITDSNIYCKTGACKA
ncbi:hypothetical protein BDZ90DRAFT_38545 [Jaminaea rosea]|uniref:Apple domain-containing protein n=1 Tax=Jaminaea rosea TaxID=1569628 RepID=A0A316UMD9_9BASI|nr:hypothetical protein BDZ90DRAFT_38545 [Jaminaea rosea]PWN26419.1 hypothetical protein BDZ90DRAFT_38545 [Jaminaea rosea]